MDSPVKERLEEYLKSQGISKTEFGRQVGVSSAYVSAIRQSISPTVIKSIALKYPNLNIDWLLTGDGIMLRSTIYDRINFVLNKEGLSKREFEKGTNTGNFLIPGAYSRAEKNPGDIEVAEPWVDSLLKLYPSYSKEWILYGKEPMEREERGSEVVSSETPTVGCIPLIPIEAFAGYGSPAFDDMRVEDYYQVAEFKQADFLIRVKGNSMYPKYSSGDIIACKVVKETLFFQWNKIYAIYTRSQGVMVKRVKKSTMEGYILLVSDNEKYEPFDVPLSDIEAIALVIGVIRVE